MLGKAGSHIDEVTQQVLLVLSTGEVNSVLLLVSSLALAFSLSTEVLKFARGMQVSALEHPPASSLSSQGKLFRQAVHEGSLFVVVFG